MLAAAQFRPEVRTALLVWSLPCQELRDLSPAAQGWRAWSTAGWQEGRKPEPGRSGGQLRGCARAGCGRCPSSVCTAGANTRRIVDGAVLAGDADGEEQAYRAAWWHCSDRQWLPTPAASLQATLIVASQKGR